MTLAEVGVLRRSESTSSIAPRCLLLAAVCAALAGRGGFFLGPRLVVGLLVGVAVLAAWRSQRASLCRPVAASLAALASWIFLSAVIAGHLPGAVSSVGAVAGLAAVVAVVGGASRIERGQMAVGAIALGALVALSGWAGVVLRSTPWAHPDGGLWRAATTVTYANGAAAVLAPLALLALGVVVARPTATLRLAATALLAGLGATLSRAGIAAFGVGLVVLVAVVGVRPVVRATLRPLGGAIIAVVALVPSMPASSPSRPVVALIGLLAGLAVAGVPTVKQWAVVPVAGAMVAAALFVVVHTHHHLSVSTVSSDRISLSSPDRSSETRVALRLLRQHPVFGIGPGRTTLAWATSDHRLVVDHYVHDEYLQLMLEDGLPAMLLVGLLGAALVDAMRKGRIGSSVDRSTSPMWGGAIAGVVCIALHSGFDFLWHIPAVVVVGAILVGLANPICVRSLPVAAQNQEVS